MNPIDRNYIKQLKHKLSQGVLARIAHVTSKYRHTSGEALIAINGLLSQTKVTDEDLYRLSIELRNNDRTAKLAKKRVSRAGKSQRARRCRLFSNVTFKPANMR